MKKDAFGFRDFGAAGALIDEYERALEDLSQCIKGLNTDQINKGIYPEHKDPSFRSIKGILTHILDAGYIYVDAVRCHMGETISYKSHADLENVDQYIAAYTEMHRYAIQLFESYPDIKMVEHDPEKQVQCPWGQRYDVDSLFEHAIVHILRHRRQIERYKGQLNQS